MVSKVDDFDFYKEDDTDHVSLDVSQDSKQRIDRGVAEHCIELMEDGVDPSDFLCGVYPAAPPVVNTAYWDALNAFVVSSGEAALGHLESLLTQKSNARSAASHLRWDVLVGMLPLSLHSVVLITEAQPAKAIMELQLFPVFHLLSEHVGESEFQLDIAKLYRLHAEDGLCLDLAVLVPLFDDVDYPELHHQDLLGVLLCSEDKEVVYQTVLALQALVQIPSNAYDVLNLILPVQERLFQSERIRRVVIGILEQVVPYSPDCNQVLESYFGDPDSCLFEIGIRILEKVVSQRRAPVEILQNAVRKATTGLLATKRAILELVLEQSREDGGLLEEVVSDDLFFLMQSMCGLGELEADSVIVQLLGEMLRAAIQRHFAADRFVDQMLQTMDDLGATADPGVAERIEQMRVQMEVLARCSWKE